MHCVPRVNFHDKVLRVLQVWSQESDCADIIALNGYAYCSWAKPLPRRAGFSITQTRDCTGRFATHSWQPYRRCNHQRMSFWNRFARWVVTWWTCAENLWTGWTPARDAASARLAKRVWPVGFDNFVRRLSSPLCYLLGVTYAEPRHAQCGPGSIWSFHIRGDGIVSALPFAGN